MRSQTSHKVKIFILIAPMKVLFKIASSYNSLNHKKEIPLDSITKCDWINSTDLVSMTFL